MKELLFAVGFSNIALVSFSFAASEPKELVPVIPQEVLVREVRVTDESGRHDMLFEVVAKVKYSNRCFSQEEKFKSLRLEGEAREYSLYVALESGRNCLKLFLPVEKEVVIDRIPLREGEGVPEVRVNGVPTK